VSLPRRRKKRKKVVDGLERQTVLPAIGSTPTRLDAGSKEKQYTEEAGIVGASPTIESVVSRARRGFHNPYFDDVVLERGVEEYLQDFTEPLRATKVDDDDDDDGDLAFLDDGNKPIQGFVEVKPKRYTRLAQIKGRYILRNNVDVRDSLPRPANMNVLLWHSAARGGEISNCKLAILNGASKSWRNERYSSDNFTPMLIAAFNGHLAMRTYKKTTRPPSSIQENIAWDRSFRGSKAICTDLSKCLGSMCMIGGIWMQRRREKRTP
jgi:hypothetical protein